MMLVRRRRLVRAMVRVFVRSLRFSSDWNTGACATLVIVPGAHEFTAREHELDHEECGRDARAAAIKHD